MEDTEEDADKDVLEEAQWPNTTHTTINLCVWWRGTGRFERSNRQSTGQVRQERPGAWPVANRGNHRGHHRRRKQNGSIFLIKGQRSKATEDVAAAGRAVATRERTRRAGTIVTVLLAPQQNLSEQEGTARTGAGPGRVGLGQAGLYLSCAGAGPGQAGWYRSPRNGPGKTGKGTNRKGKTKSICIPLGNLYMIFV